MGLDVKKHPQESKSMKIKDIITEKTNSKYLGPTEKVGNISPVLKGSYGKKQKKLMSKFFGSS